LDSRWFLIAGRSSVTGKEVDENLFMI